MQLLSVPQVGAVILIAITLVQGTIGADLSSDSYRQTLCQHEVYPSLSRLGRDRNLRVFYQYDHNHILLFPNKVLRFKLRRSMFEESHPMAC
jgi:hypothetical protein